MIRGSSQHPLLILDYTLIVPLPKVDRVPQAPPLSLKALIPHPYFSSVQGQGDVSLRWYSESGGAEMRWCRANAGRQVGHPVPGRELQMLYTACDQIEGVSTARQPRQPDWPMPSPPGTTGPLAHGKVIAELPDL